MTDYIHGYSADECERLVAQAEILAPTVFANMDLSHATELLEIGCGVGAQTKQFLQRWPQLKISAVDKSASHLEFAKQYLSQEVAAGHVQHFEHDIAELPFADNTFDAAVSIWVLEHTTNSAEIFTELARVLKPGGTLLLTEVDNSTFRFSPDNPLINSWWEKFNYIQEKFGAQPLIGKRLARLAQAAGFGDIHTHEFAPISSSTPPAQRLKLFRYLGELLLSARNALLQEGLIQAEDAENLAREWKRLETEEVDFQYCAVHLRAVAA